MWGAATTAPVALLHDAASGEAERFLPPLVPVVAPVAHLKRKKQEEKMTKS